MPVALKSSNSRYAAGALIGAIEAAPAALAQPPAPPQRPAPAAAPPADCAGCQACHETTAGARPSLGPNLFGVGGRKAGSIADFDYSDAMKASTTVWDAETLKAFILDPAKAMPGNKMDYPGASDETSAKAIADYLMSLKG